MACCKCCCDARTPPGICCDGECSDVCCCCTVDEFDNPVITTAYDGCDGTYLKTKGSGCVGASITVEWCGLQVSASHVVDGESSYTQWDWTATCNPNDPGAECTEFTLLTITDDGNNSPPVTRAFYTGCGDNCYAVLRAAVFQCGDAKDGRIFWREGCDNEAIWVPGSTTSLCGCNESEPVITVSVAP